MKTVEEHYAGHLAPIYLWMVGGHEAVILAASAELDALHLPARAYDTVLDLGAGFGAHAITLARRGACVTAVDSSHELLETMRQLSCGLDLEIVHAELMNYLQTNKCKFHAILCMGDTLTHLRSVQEVTTLSSLVARSLQPGGTFVATFRDYTEQLHGEQRFIPVRADGSRILTCFLEFSKLGVLVHDIVHERMDDGWQTRVSAYRKLRLNPGSLADELNAAGLQTRIEAGLRGMVRLIAVKPDAAGKTQRWESSQV